MTKELRRWTMDRVKCGLDNINSMTKYPSILTYHKMADKGRLLNEVKVPFDSQAIVTEKINGVNARIIMYPNGFYMVGSRDELLYARGDLLKNRQLGIVDAMEEAVDQIVPGNDLMVYYFEVYGGGTTKASKQYTGWERVGYRLFDIAVFPDSDDIVDMSVERIASWRDNGGQTFLNDTVLAQVSFCSGLELTPRLGVMDVPVELTDTYEWMKKVIPNTLASLDEGAKRRPEGVVIRTPDRSRIAKLRFEDYERTMRMHDGKS